MSHLHVPDGVLPAWLLAASWVLLCALLFLALWGHRQRDTILLGISVPFVVAAMSVPLPVHLNLLVLVGILAGPWVGLLTAFLSVSILALFGHGGLSAIALNSLVLGIEPIMGWWLFYGFRLAFTARSARLSVYGSAAFATAGALLCSLLFSLLALLLIVQSGDFATEQFHKLRLVAVFLPMALLAGVLEMMVTGLCVLYVHRVRPHLVPGWPP